MGKAYKINKNNTVSIIPHVNYMYGVSTKRFNRIITTTRMPDYFTYLGGSYDGSEYRAHCGFAVFDGNLYTFSGRGYSSSDDAKGSTATHIDNLGDGMTKNDSTHVGTVPALHINSSSSGLVMYNNTPHIAVTNGLSSTGSSIETTARTDFFDLIKGEWLSSYNASLLTPLVRRMGAGGIISRRYSYSIAGSNNSGAIVNTNYMVDVNAITVSTRAACPGSRNLPCSCIVSDRYIYIAGGHPTASTLSSSFFRYDHSDNSWSTLTSLPFVSRSGCLIHDQRNTDRIWYFGGASTSNFQSNSRIYYYTISTGTWTQFSQSLPIACRALNGFCTPEGVMILFNFETSTYNTVQSVYAFDPNPYNINPTSDTRPNALILYCNSLLGRNRRIRPIISSKVTGNPYINLFAIKEINNKTPGPLLYAGSSTSSYRTQFLNYFNNFKTVTHTSTSVPSTNCNTNNILDYSVKEIGGMFKWDKL